MPILLYISNDKKNLEITLISKKKIFSVTLQPFKYNPEEKYRHKFMVQSVTLHEDDTTGSINVSFLLNSDIQTSKNNG